MNELDVANENFSFYLKDQLTPKFFEESIQYKFLIAQAFENGAKRHFLGNESMPKWISGKREAIEIYDEVITALPQHDLAVQSLFGKANILFAEQDFKESIEVFQTLLRRFPKSPLARDSYVAITKVYKIMSEKEYADPDFLDLAAINIKKFKADFSEDPKIAEAQEILQSMMEVYAKDLFKTAQFYERTKKPKASIIYYTKIMSKYPNTKIAMKSQERLNVLLPKYGNKEEKINIPQKAIPIIVDNSSVDSIERQ
ncbi:MAG: tetratricopeptide repeat protein [Verrucomicrobia bacterium]|nr:tetratricopeptide repeat protein [Verrucomicrobiota bacterium]